MKKIEIKGKLSLNKSTIARLNSDDLNQIKGGGYAMGGGTGGGSGSCWPCISTNFNNPCTNRSVSRPQDQANCNSWFNCSALSLPGCSL